MVGVNEKKVVLEMLLQTVRERKREILRKDLGNRIQNGSPECFKVLLTAEQFTVVPISDVLWQNIHKQHTTRPSHPFSLSLSLSLSLCRLSLPLFGLFFSMMHQQ